MELKEKLSLIQNEMKVPKNQRNNFGNYNYRNAEDILETAKPICKEHKTTLVVFDEMVCIGERYYVKAIAKLLDWESDIEITATAYAREAESKKGMDDSQVTGSTSSYARKYALNGLFNIDDTKDSDFTNTHGKDKKQANDQQQGLRITQVQKDKIIKAIAQSKIDLDGLKEYYKIKSVDELDHLQAQSIIDKKLKGDK